MVGASGTPCTVTVDATASPLAFTLGAPLGPLSTTWVSVTVRVPSVGAWLVFAYARPLTRDCVAAVEIPAPLVRVTVAVEPVTLTE